MHFNTSGSRALLFTLLVVAASACGGPPSDVVREQVSAIAAGAPSPGHLMIFDGVTLTECDDAGAIVASDVLPYAAWGEAHHVAVDQSRRVSVLGRGHGSQSSYLAVRKGASTWNLIAYPDLGLASDAQAVESWEDDVFAASLGGYSWTSSTTATPTPPGILRFSGSEFVGQGADGVRVTDLSMGLDARLYALLDDGMSVHVYDPATLDLVEQLQLDQVVDALVVGASAELFAITDDAQLVLFDPSGVAQDSVTLDTIDTSSGAVTLADLELTDVALHANGTIAVGSDAGAVFLVDQKLSVLRTILVGGARTYVAFVP